MKLKYMEGEVADGGKFTLSTLTWVDLKVQESLNLFECVLR